MRRIDWIIVILPLFITWGIDRVAKTWAEGLMGISFYGPIGFVLHHNHGAMLGLFSDLPAVLRIVTLSTGGAFLLFSFGIIQYLLGIKSLMLRAGMSTLLGGILGNVTDRILYGYVIDFILIGTPEKASPAFNPADALQWVGYGMIAFALIRESELLWPAENSRKSNWVNLKFQLRYCFMLMGIGLGFAAIAGVFSYTFLRVTIIDLVGSNQRLLDHYLIPFTITFIIVSISFSVILFLVGRILSSRIAGPLYAFEKFLDDLVDGRPRVFRLRAGDEFKHLEQLAERIAQQMIEKNLVTVASDPTPDPAPAGSGLSTPDESSGREKTDSTGTNG